MTTYTTISNAAVAVGAIPSSTTVTALRDNPTAIAEASSGAPVVFAGWHPVDKVSVGDSANGLIYDHAVTGNVSSVVTPNFEDGYEYRVVASDLLCDSASTVRLNLEGFYQTDATYYRIRYSGDGTGTSFRWGYDLEIVTPRIARRSHLANGWTYKNGDFGNDGVDSAAYDSTVQKLLRARVRFTTGNISGGKIHFFRRREYASLP
jgi:hypothetical protein